MRSLPLASTTTRGLPSSPGRTGGRASMVRWLRRSSLRQSAAVQLAALQQDHVKPATASSLATIGRRRRRR